MAQLIGSYTISLYQSNVSFEIRCHYIKGKMPIVGAFVRKLNPVSPSILRQKKKNNKYYDNAMIDMLLSYALEEYERDGHHFCSDKDRK